jgi:hypothetical protein
VGLLQQNHLRIIFLILIATKDMNSRNKFNIRSDSKVSNGGYSFVEVIIYLAMLIILLTAIINGTLLLAQSYRSVKVVRDIESSAITSMDRMTREIHDASDINGTLTTYNTNPGSLELDTTDTSGTAITLRFYALNGKVMMDKNGVTEGQLTESDVHVSSLIFRSITSSSSVAIKIEMTLQGTSTSNGTSSLITKNFYDTAVVRGSY